LLTVPHHRARDLLTPRLRQRSLWSININSSSDQRCTKFIEPSEAFLRLDTIGRCDSEDECLNNDECGPAAGKKARYPTSTSEDRVHRPLQPARRHVGDEDSGHPKAIGLLEQHIDETLQPAVRNRTRQSFG
jgi:hypothetical protein